MSFAQLVTQLLEDTLKVSLGAFKPELALCATIVALLLVRMILPAWKTAAWYVAMAGLAVALWLLMPSVVKALGGKADVTPLFTGLLVEDSFSVFLRGLLLLFGLLFTTFVQISGIPDNDDAGEFCVLVLGALIGMCLMVSANHMLIVFLGVEMASVPCYVLAGLLRHNRPSTEASLKYAVYGAGAAGVMLYGISLLCGVLGSAHLPTMAVRLAQLNLVGATGDQTMVLVLGGLMVMVGLAFKLSAFPFHFWAPDVFEGAPAEIGAFLSIASKAAALALLVRLTLGFGYIPEKQQFAADVSRFNQDLDIPFTQQSFQLATPAFGGFEPPAQTDAVKSPASEHNLNAALAPTRKFMVGLLTLLAAVTCTFGNLAAYGQTNIKRLLAYSTIAHAGYLLMPVAAAVGMAGSDEKAARDAIAAMVFYIAIYLFMNFGAFAIVAFVRNASGSEQINDYASMIRRSPGVTVCMAIILFSLVGLPPLAGFAAKFAIFGALVRADMLLLLAIGGLNTVLSLFYYLRIVRVMILQPEPVGHTAPMISMLSIPGLYAAVITVPIVALFIWWDGLFGWAQAAAKSLLM